MAIEFANEDWRDRLSKKVSCNNINTPLKHYIEKKGISSEVFNWFEEKTLNELLTIHEVISASDENEFLLEKVIFSSILCSCSSQRKHYTYITDGCFPDNYVYKNAKKFFTQKVALATRAAQVFNEQYKRRHSKVYKFDGDIRRADARNLSWIRGNSLDLVVTSPPYLGTHDYLKALRLTNLFFPEEDFKKYLADEIGARCKRHKKNAYEEYLGDMKKSFDECHRILRPGGFMGIVIGRGKGRVIKSDILTQLLDFLTAEEKFAIVYRNTRNISSRRIRFPGVMMEHILVLEKLGNEMPNNKV